MTTDFSDPESARLNALFGYNILDSLPEEEYDAITRIASQICGMPISMITLLDEHRQWFKSTIGMVQRQTPRNYAFCDHAIQTPDQLMEVADARLDSRFVNNPLTIDAPHVIFYAGVPLVDEEGYALGTLCVIDNKPNKLTDQQAATLKSLARQVVILLKLRRNQQLLEAANKKLYALNEKLDESNQVLNLVVDNCPAGLILWQTMREQGRIVDFKYLITNPFNASVVGMSVEHMLGSTLKTLFPNIGNTDIVQRLTEAVETGLPSEYQQHNRFDQVDIWGSYSLVPLGEQVLMIYQDITQLKKNEDDLRVYSENLEQLVAERATEISQLAALQNAILEHAGFAIISTDGQGMIQTVNPATLHLLGYQASDLVGKREVSTLFHPVALVNKAQFLSNRLGHPVPANFSVFKLILSDGSYECVMIDKNGRHVPVLLITTPLWDKTDIISGYVMMVTDITALKTARAELEKRNQELNTFFDVALDLHCIATTDGTILKVNRSWETTLDYTTDELLRMNHFDLIHPSDRAATETVIGGTTSQHTYVNHINRFRRKDGTFRVIEWNVVTVDKLLYASARDITDRQQAEKQLKKLNQRLQLATRAAGQGIWEYNSERDSLIWDRQMFAIHGLDYSEVPIRALDYLLLVHPDDRHIIEDSRKADTSITSYRVEVRIILPDGTIRYTELHGSNRFNRTGERVGSVGIIWDITERKMAEQQLKKLNQRLQLATRAAGQGIWEYNREQDIMTWDEQLCIIHGTDYTGLPMHLADYRQLIHPEDVPDFLQRHHLAQNGSTFINERRIIRPDGEVRYTELFGIRTFSESGQSLGSVGVVRDITDRKNAEIALRQSEKNYRSLVDNLKEVVYQTNLNGEITFLNPFWTTMTGYLVDESLGQPFYVYVSPGGQRKSQTMFTEFITHHKMATRLVVGYRHKSGQDCWAEVFAQVLTDSEGHPVGTTGTVTDITERKHALDALRRSEQRFRDIAENINEIFWIHSAQPLQLLYINPAYELITGLSAEALYENALDFLDLVVDEDKPVLKAAFAHYRQGQEISVQYRTRTTTSNLRWFEIRTFVKKNSNGTPLSYIGLASDITSQKEKEDVLQQSLAREQELNRLKSQFVSTASHEFRTPLATIQSSVDLIKLYIEQPAAKALPAIQRHLGVIEKEIANFSGLLADILTFGKIEAGKIPFFPQWVDIVSLAEAVIATHFSERTDGRTVQVLWVGTPRPLYADEKLISHALVNLLSNAFKFSAANPALHIDFTPGQFTMVVSDRGIGIPADDQAHLFETFFRARNAVNIQGSGLGLVITRQFIERHGGQLTIRSEENEGTACLIKLPD